MTYREWLVRSREALTKTRRVGALERSGAHLGGLSAGDRLIFYALAVLVAVASVTALYALERTFLVEVPSYGGTLTEGETGSPRFINPLLALSDADRDLSALSYAGLMGISGSGALVPALAESYTASPDGKTYTFTIRKGAQFSDGTPVTAADVVFTVEKAQDPALKSREYVNWAGVHAEAVDARTVRFSLSKPYAPFPWLATLGILPAHLWQNISDEQFPFSELQTNPVGAGPFMVTNVARDASGLIRSVSLSANPHYVLGRPYLDGITFNFYPRSEDLVRAFRSGAVESAAEISAKGARTAPYARVFGVFFNPSANAVYARPEVRKALSIAIDRSKIVQTVLGGYATPIAGPVPPGAGVRQAPVPASPDPVAAAADVLKAAGWVYDGAARVWKNPSVTVKGSTPAKKLELDHITLRTSNVPELKNVAVAVKEDWERLGIPVDIELYESGDLSQNVIRPRKYEALLYGMVIGRDQDLYAFWDSHERNDPGLNIAQYANKTVDSLLEDIRTNADPRARATDLQKVEDAIAADYPAAFLYAPDFTYAIPSDLRGVELPQIGTPADRFATVARWYRATDAVWPFFAKNR